MPDRLSEALMQTTRLTPTAVKLSRVMGVTRLADGETAANKAVQDSLLPKASRVLTPLTAIILLTLIAYNSYRARTRR